MPSYATSRRDSNSKSLTNSGQRRSQRLEASPVVIGAVDGDVACEVTTAREAMASGDIDLAPDYVTVGGTAIVPILGPFGLGVNGGATNTPSGHVYGFPGPAGGLAGANAEVRAGYIINCPDPCDADSFVTGWSVTGGGFAPLYPPGSPVGVGGIEGFHW
jgi:hypothetical protein